MTKLSESTLLSQRLILRMGNEEEQGTVTNVKKKVIWLEIAPRFKAKTEETMLWK